MISNFVLILPLKILLTEWKSSSAGKNIWYFLHFGIHIYRQLSAVFSNIHMVSRFDLFLMSDCRSNIWKQERYGPDPYAWETGALKKPAGTSMRNDICSLIAPTPGLVPQGSPQEGYKLCYRDAVRHIREQQTCHSSSWMFAGPNISSKIWRKCPIKISELALNRDKVGIRPAMSSSLTRHEAAKFAS